MSQEGELALAGGDEKGLEFHLGKIGVKEDEIGVTEDEVAVLESCVSQGTSTGIAALVSHDLTSLTIVAEAVAALSCEALQADTTPLESKHYKESAFISKAEANVAGDLSFLLSGSKLLKPRKGGAGPEFARGLPSSFGALRDTVKVLAARINIEINQPESGDARFSSISLVSAILSLLNILRTNTHGSLDRASRSFSFICELGAEGESSADWKTNVEGLRTRQGIAIREAYLGTADSEGDRGLLSSLLMEVVDSWKRSLAMECAAALVLLSVRESASAGLGALAGQDGGQGLGNAGNKGRNEAAAGAAARPGKQRKNFVLGTGTEAVRKSLISYLNADEVAVEFGIGDSIATIEKKLFKFLNPYVEEFNALSAKLKNVLQSNETGRLPKNPKGTRDFKPEQMAIREKAFGIIASTFKRHGAVALDTPVFELRETLTGKYGEDSKLIYDLADQGGELLSLRYDLTVPFARFLAMHKVENLKRYHIAKVYRRDNPAKGRYREFYQCDFDIAGQYPSMVPDFEVLKVTTELLDELDIGPYEVKLNHRQLLDGMLDICGVPQAKFRSICSAIDKLDKLPWEKVREEMVNEKGLPPETADKIGELVRKRGQPSVLLEELQRKESPFLQHKGSVTALEELALLFKYLKAAKCVDRIVFDLSLARGLDYYTGVIYEAVFKGTEQVGSIAAGGRYDNLVGMFSKKRVPAVGVSLGIERVFAILEQREVDQNKMRSSQTEVMVVVLGSNDVKWTEEAIRLVTELWEGGLKAEFKCVAGAKLAQQIGNAAKSGIPWLVIAGEDEIKGGIVGLRDIAARSQEEVKREDLVAELKRRIGTASESPPFVA